MLLLFAFRATLAMVLQVIDKHSEGVRYFTGKAMRFVAISTAITSKEGHHALEVCVLFSCVVVLSNNN